jgi:hypothetical protein
MRTLDDFKSDYKRSMESFTESAQQTDDKSKLLDLIVELKKQDYSDRKYLISKKIVPALFGITTLSLLFIFVQIPNKTMLMGSILILCSLISILVLFIRDLVNISSESFGMSLREYLESKKTSFVKWKRIPILYNIIYGVFVVGVILLIVGNTKLGDLFSKSSMGLILYMSCIIGALIVSGFAGELRFRKRFKKEHKPFLDRISDLINELDTDETI